MRSHFDDCSGLNIVSISKDTSVSTRPPYVNANVVVHLRLNITQSILANLKSYVAQVEKMVLDDTQLLHSLEAEEQTAAPT